MENKNIKLGIFCIVLSGIGFSLMALFVKLSGDLPTMQKSFFRNFIAALVAAIPLIKNLKIINYPKIKLDWFILFLRSLFGTIGILCNFYAISHLNLADSTVIQRLYPFVVIILSFMFFNEKISKKGLLSLVLAFFAVILVVKPSFDNFLSLGAIMALCGAFCSGAAYTALRRLGTQGISPEFVVFTFSLFSCLVVVPSIITDYSPMSIEQVVYLIFVGIFAAVGQFGITYAYKFAAARSLAVFDYLQIVFSGILGYIFFTEIPDIYSIIGYLIIVFTGLFITYSKK